MAEFDHVCIGCLNPDLVTLETSEQIPICRDCWERIPIDRRLVITAQFRQATSVAQFASDFRKLIETSQRPDWIGEWLDGQIPDGN